MWRAIIAAIAVVLAAASPAAAHGGGGTFVYVPMFIYNAPPQVPDAKAGAYDSIHKVAIVTAIGQTLTIGRAGWFADRSSADISGMKLDDAVDTAIRRYLPTQFSVVDVPYDRAKLAAIDNGYLDTSTTDFQNYLKALAAPGVDAFIVVRPDGEKGAPTPGLSLDKDDYSSRPIMRANFEVDVVDARSGAIIAHALSRLQAVQGTVPNFAAIYVPDELKMEPDQIPTDAQRAGLEPQLKRLLIRALAQTLHVLKLNETGHVPDLRPMAPVPDSIRPKVMRIAIVSTAADTLTLDDRGPAPGVSKTQIADWNIDQEIEKKVAALLDKRFTVVPANVDRTKAARIFVVEEGMRNSKLTLPAGALPSTPGIDAYLVIAKAINIENDAGHTFNLEQPGLVLRHVANGDDPATTDLCVSYAGVLFDAQTRKPISWFPGVTTPDQPSWEPILPVDNADWPGKDPFNVLQAADIHGRLRDIFDDTLPETVMEMQLAPVMPEDEIADAVADAAARAKDDSSQAAPQ